VKGNQDPVATAAGSVFAQEKKNLPGEQKTLDRCPFREYVPVPNNIAFRDPCAKSILEISG
jgi:hypothetical protein